MPKVKTSTSKASEGHRKWKEEEIVTMLDHCLTTIQENRFIEKPTALRYWNDFLQTIKFENCTANVLRHKFRMLKDKYNKFSNWLSHTGQTAEPDQVDAMKKKICPFYDKLHELLSEKSSVHPPAGVELGTADASVILNGDPDLPISDVVFDEEDLQEIMGNQDPAGPKVNLAHSSMNSRFPSSFELNQRVTSTERGKASKQSRMLEAYEAKSKVKYEELQVEQKKLEFEKDKWMDERQWRERQLDMEESREKHRMDMEIRASENEALKVKNQFELEKLRIEKEAELQIKMAKIQKGLDV